MRLKENSGLAEPIHDPLRWRWGDGIPGRGDASLDMLHLSQGIL